MTTNTNTDDSPTLYVGGMGYTQSGAKVHRLVNLGENPQGTPQFCLATHGGGAMATWHKKVEDYSEVDCAHCLRRL